MGTPARFCRNRGSQPFTGLELHIGPGGGIPCTRKSVAPAPESTFGVNLQGYSFAGTGSGKSVPVAWLRWRYHGRTISGRNRALHVPVASRGSKGRKPGSASLLCDLVDLRG